MKLNSEVHCNIREYHSWSLNNMSHSIFPHFMFQEDNVLILVSDKVISEMELFGLECLVKHWSKGCTHRNSNTIIIKAQYNQKYDSIRPLYNLTLEESTLKKLYTIFKVSENHAGYTGKEAMRKKLTEAKTIICIYNFFTQSRDDKSWWWKLRNPRKNTVINAIGYF